MQFLRCVSEEQSISQISQFRKFRDRALSDIFGRNLELRDPRRNVSTSPVRWTSRWAKSGVQSIRSSNWIDRSTRQSSNMGSGLARLKNWSCMQRSRMVFEDCLTKNSSFGSDSRWSPAFFSPWDGSMSWQKRRKFEKNESLNKGAFTKSIAVH